MSHGSLLLATIAAALGVAFLFGWIAVRLKLPPTVGYLLAGVLLGPFTPDFIASSEISEQISEVGVVLLMFGVGLHFSVGDLAAVRRVVIPGAIALTTLTTALGAALGRWWGWGWGAALVLGLALGSASTAVLLKGLEGRDRLDSPEGRIAVGWLVVEDLLMVLALVLLPALAPMLRDGGAVAASGAQMAASVAIALAKVAGFVALMIVVGRRFVPWLLAHVARLGTRELFTLAVLGTALGVGTIAAGLFGVSFALGAFFAGAVISESELSQRAAAEALPMQDAFAVLFFVSVGLLFDPAVLLEHPVRMLVLTAVIVLWKSAVAYGVLRVLGEPPRHALVVGAALGQIGDFSFIVAALGIGLGLVTRDVEALIVAAAILSITVNAGTLGWAMAAAQRLGSQLPAVDAIARWTREMRSVPAGATLDEGSLDDPYDFSELAGHVVLIGYGRVGETVADALARAGVPYVVIEEQERTVGGLRTRGERAILGDATREQVLQRAGIAHAKLLVVTASEPYRARHMVELARTANPRVAVAVRTHNAAEQQFFEELLASGGALGRAVYAEREAALNLSHFALIAIGRSDDEADFIVELLRGMPTAPTETFKSIPTQEYRTLVGRGGG